MKFETPAGFNSIDEGKFVGKPVPRIDGPMKVTGRAPYAYDRHDAVANQAYGFILGSAIAKGDVTRIDLAVAKGYPGVLAIVTTLDMPPVGRARQNVACLFGGSKIQHYHQAVAVVVAETFEQARAAAGQIQIHYKREDGAFDLAAQLAESQVAAISGSRGDVDSNINRTGDFESAFAAAEVTLDATYTTQDQTHAMMEPHATIAAWQGDKLTLWTSHQVISRGRRDIAQTLRIPEENVRLESPFIGGGFGAKLFVRADAVLAALGSKAVGRPVRVALTRSIVPNNTIHRAASIQRIRLGTTKEGKITAIAHEGISGNLPGGGPEMAVHQTRLLYSGANRLTSMRVVRLDLPEANAMRAPGEATGHLALEIAMDEMAEKLGIDPVQFRIINDTELDPENPDRPFSSRQLVKCLQVGASRFGWDKRGGKPAERRDGDWILGMGVAAGIRNNLLIKSAARVRLNSEGFVTVEMDMTDIGTGTYTIVAQTAAEMMGVEMHQVEVRLGDSSFPATVGSGGQGGANNSTSAVYAACLKLRETVALRLGLDPSSARFRRGRVFAGERSIKLGNAAKDHDLIVEDFIEYGDLGKKFQQSTFAAHFVEVGVDSFTKEIRLRRMLAVCAAGRILNPQLARSQVIGAMTMGVGAALMEGLVVDTRFGCFVNHDLANYEVPVHADIPHQEVIFLDEVDPFSSPMKAKGVGELGLCGVGAAVANAVANATGKRLRQYPITLDKLL